MGNTAYSITKLIVVAFIALALIFGMIFGLDPTWGVPALTMLLGYIVGNADVSDTQRIVEIKSE